MHVRFNLILQFCLYILSESTITTACNEFSWRNNANMNQ